MVIIQAFWFPVPSAITYNIINLSLAERNKITKNNLEVEGEVLSEVIVVLFVDIDTLIKLELLSEFLEGLTLCLRVLDTRQSGYLLMGSGEEIGSRKSVSLWQS